MDFESTQWLIGASLGIRRDDPGFHSFIVEPELDPTGTITSAQGYYDSMYGRISSAWKIDHGVLAYRATVPGNTTATLYLPAIAEEAVKESGKEARSVKEVRFVKFENGKAIYHLESGSYAFTATLR